MDNNSLTQKRAAELIALPGKTRGVVFQTDAQYVKDKQGEGGLKKVETLLKKINCPIDYHRVKATSWHPIGLRVVSLLAVREAFNWGEKEVEEMGSAAPKYSFIVRLLLKYFISFETTYKKSPAYWEKHYTVGKLDVPDYKLGEKTGYGVIRLKEFNVHPIICPYLKGYFATMFRLVLKEVKNFNAEELKCVHRGDSYHEFKIKWDY